MAVGDMMRDTLDLMKVRLAESRMDYMDSMCREY